MTWTIDTADAKDWLESWPDESVDSMVTDPPAGISFMGHGWDSDKGGRDAWIDWLASIMRQALRALKPGGHALVWALPRTSHWTATALEDAGFEIRDVITYHHCTGFPKGANVGRLIDRKLGKQRPVIGYNDNARPNRVGKRTKLSGKQTIGGEITKPASPESEQWEGWNSSLKPATENWILCRKPLDGGLADNVLKHGVGALNVGACKIGNDNRYNPPTHKSKTNALGSFENCNGQGTHTKGRWPANAIFDEHAGALLDSQSGYSKSTDRPRKNKAYKSVAFGQEYDNVTHGHSDSGGASRFYFCPKPSKRERSAGLESANPHATVKAIKLMRWLCRLITPADGLVIDPFTGSGSTGIAACLEGFRFAGCELDPEYADLACKRLAHWTDKEAA